MSADATGPTIELLRTFAYFAELGEVKRTAETLGLDQSVVSRRLKALQADPPALLRKAGNAVVLTDKGTAALPGVVRLLREYDDLAGRFVGRGHQTQPLRVAAGGGLAFTPLPQAVAAFRQQHPDIPVRVISCRGRDRIRGVAAGEFDVAIVGHDEGQVRAVAGESADLRMQVLRHQSVVVAADATSADGRTLAALPPDRPVPSVVLAKLTLLGLDERSGIRRQLDAEFRSASLPVPRPVVYPGGWEAARAFARHGLGTALLPAELAGTPLIVRPVFPTYRLTDRVVWPATEDLRTTAFVACLVAVFAPMDG